MSPERSSPTVIVFALWLLVFSASSQIMIISPILPQIGDELNIADAVSKGLMNVQIQTSTPIVFGVLTCLNEAQVKARSTAPNNHGSDWGKTAVEMALLRTEAMGGKAADATLKELGFGGDGAKSNVEKETEADKKKVGFF